MKKTSLHSALLMGLLLVTFAFTACNSDDTVAPDDNGKVHHVQLSRKTSYGNDWIYYSLRENKELTGIDESNHRTDLSWDIAFNRYNVRTNSGLSGQGEGGAFDTGKTNMAEVKQVPEGAVFVVDEKGLITDNGQWTEAGPPTVESTLNPLLSKSIDFQGPPPTYTPNYHIYLVKTADGKYAKLLIKGFHNDEGESGYISFAYEFQPDGTSDFD